MPDVEQLRALSRQTEWTFPSSLGTPLDRDTAGDWLEQALAERDSFIEAARLLDDEAAVELAADVWRLWIVSRDMAGGRAFLAEVLDRGAREPTRARALALYGDSLLAYRQGDVAASRQRSEEALEAARASGDPEALALAHVGLSRAAFSEEDFERSLELAVEARRHAETLIPAMLQAPLHQHAQSARLLERWDEAGRVFAESLDLNRRIGDDGMVVVDLHNLGHVEVHRGNVEAAERLFAELLALHGGGDDPYDLALARLNEAVVARARGDRERAVALLAELDSILAESATELSSDDAFEVEWLRAALG